MPAWPRREAPTWIGPCHLLLLEGAAGGRERPAGYRPDRPHRPSLRARALSSGHVASPAPPSRRCSTLERNESRPDLVAGLEQALAGGKLADWKASLPPSWTMSTKALLGCLSGLSSVRRRRPPQSARPPRPEARLPKRLRLRKRSRSKAEGVRGLAPQNAPAPNGRRRNRPPRNPPKEAAPTESAHPGKRTPEEKCAPRKTAPPEKRA